MSELLRNSEFVWAVMAILIFAVTFLFKYPYKKLTGKITNETTRKLANKAIVLFAFTLGLVFNFFYCEYFELVFTVQESLKYSLTAISLHSVLEIKSKGKIKSDFNTEEAKELIDSATEIAKDKTKSNESAVKEFWNSVKKK
jgi:hypothetical protein